MPTGKTHSTQPDSMSAPEGPMSWPLLALALCLFVIGLSKLFPALALPTQIIFAGGAILCGTLLTVLAFMWNWSSSLRAEKQELISELAQLKKANDLQQSPHMMATLGHEIRTPLNGVIGMLGLLLESELSAQQRNYASIAHGSGRTLLSILDEMLDRAKSEHGNAAAQGSVELAVVIENVTELLAPRAHAKHIEISSCIDKAIPLTLPFRDLHIRQILFNLAGNAIKFTHKGGVSIRARLLGQQLELSIRDTGIGMSADEQARLFNEFAQANDQTQQRYGGTGLGLVISKNLVESMGGQLQLQSIQGVGTTFVITLPLQQITANDEPQRLSGRHYILAMPDNMLRYDLLKNLEAQGATVTSTTSTHDRAFNEALNSNATAVICDAAAAKRLTRLAKLQTKQKKLLPQIWLLLNPEERRSLRSLLVKPTTGYLMKPVRRSTLVRQLTEHDGSHVAERASQLHQLSKSSAKSRKLRLLLVEDTPVNALLAKTLLTKAGHETVVVTSGRAALDLLAEDRIFDGILMDVEMPGMSGHDTTRSLRALEKEKALDPLPVLALTANVRNEDVAACLSAGMNGHLAKPFERADLEEALVKLTRRQAA
jgi:signal transduction histidine kinase/CheY-like chemotaxis protein